MQFLCQLKHNNACFIHIQGHGCGCCSINIQQVVLTRFNWGVPAPLADSQAREDPQSRSEEAADNEVNEEMLLNNIRDGISPFLTFGSGVDFSLSNHCCTLSCDITLLVPNFLQKKQFLVFMSFMASFFLISFLVSGDIPAC